MSGYCKDCGNAICCCRRIKQEEAVVKRLFIEKKLKPKYKTDIENLEKELQSLKKQLEEAKEVIKIIAEETGLESYENDYEGWSYTVQERARQFLKNIDGGEN